MRVGQRPEGCAQPRTTGPQPRSWKRRDDPSWGLCGSTACPRHDLTRPGEQKDSCFKPPACHGLSRHPSPGVGSSLP